MNNGNNTIAIIKNGNGASMLATMDNGYNSDIVVIYNSVSVISITDNREEPSVLCSLLIIAKTLLLVALLLFPISIMQIILTLLSVAIIALLIPPLSMMI